jgi:hypothetical protein
MKRQNSNESKTNLGILFLLFSFLYIHSEISAQDQTFCDSLKSLNQMCRAIGTYAEPVKRFTEINNDFFHAVNVSNIKNKLYIKLFIDSTGKVRCTDLFRGSGDKHVDSIAVEFVKSLKFVPATYGNGEKTGMWVMFPLPYNIKF